MRRRRVSFSGSGAFDQQRSDRHAEFPHPVVARETVAFGTPRLRSDPRNRPGKVEGAEAVDAAAVDGDCQRMLPGGKRSEFALERGERHRLFLAAVDRYADHRRPETGEVTFARRIVVAESLRQPGAARRKAQSRRAGFRQRELAVIGQVSGVERQPLRGDVSPVQGTRRRREPHPVAAEFHSEITEQVNIT